MIKQKTIKLKSLKKKTIKLKANKNTTDFYTEINHKWLKTHKIQKNKSCLDLFNILERKINVEINKCFENLKKNNNKVRKIWKSFQKQNNDLTIQQIVSVCQRFQDTGNDLYKTLALSMQYGIDIVMAVVVMEDCKKPEHKCVTIMETSLSSPDVTIFQNPQSLETKKFRKVFIRFLENIFCCVFGKNHSFEVEDIWDMEVELSKHMYKVSSVPIETYYNVYKTDGSFQNIHLKELLLSMGMKDIPSNIIIHNPKFFQHYLTLFGSNKMRILILYRVIAKHSLFHTELRKLFFAFYSTFLQGIPKQETYSVESFKLLQDSIFKTALNKEYINLMPSDKEVKCCKQMITDIVKQMIIRIENNNYLHKRTKEMAIDKIKNVQFVVGSSEKFKPCFLDNVSLEDISDENPFINMQHYRDFMNKQVLDTFNEKRILLTKEWDTAKCGNVYDVNAYYLASENIIVIPLGILKPPFLDVNKSLAHNLAFLGSTIGHELFHAIDDEGCKFDKYGNYKNWWTKEDLKHYKSSQRSIVKIYEQYALQQDNIKIDGTNTLGENIADIGGMLLSEMVLLDSSGDKDTNGDKDNILKVFFSSYAKQWRILYSKKDFEMKRHRDVHALYKYRTNCVLLFSKEFQRLYNNETNELKSFFW